LRIVPLAPDLVGAYGALFEACGSACFCRYWGFEGTKNEWLERTFSAPHRSLEEQAALVREGDAGAGGLLALDPDDPGAALGWMKLAPRPRMAKLLRQGPYRALAATAGPPGDAVWIVGCLLVHPAHRGRGVARRLIAAADDAVRARGGVAIEAYPRGTATATARLHAEEAWMGTDALFASLGFTRIAGEEAYPVYRKELGPQPGTATSPAATPSSTSSARGGSRR
jgi:GNAT superfamily N-acetyltransferase